MRRFEATELFGLEQNKIAGWIKKKQPRLHKLADLLTVVTLDRAKEILSREKVQRSIDDVKVLFGFRKQTLSRYPVLMEFLQKISFDEIMMLCLIDSKNCFLDNVYSKEVQEFFIELQQNNEVEKDIEYLKEIFEATSKSYQNNNKAFIERYLKPFADLAGVLLGCKIEIKPVYKENNLNKIKLIIFRKLEER